LESDLFAEETAELQVKGVGATKDTRGSLVRQY